MKTKGIEIPHRTRGSRMVRIRIAAHDRLKQVAARSGYDMIDVLDMAIDGLRLPKRGKA